MKRAPKFTEADFARFCPNWEQALLEPQKVYEVFDAIMSSRGELPEAHSRKLSESERERRRQEAIVRRNQRFRDRMKSDPEYAAKVREANRLCKQRTKLKAMAAAAK